MAVLVRKRLYNPRRAAVVSRIRALIEGRSFIKAEMILDITVRKDVASQDLSLLWNEGLLVKRKGVGRTWLYYWKEYPPSAIGVLQAPEYIAKG
jgi:hypothetical protein